MARAATPVRLPGLDLLRAFAIAWVMVAHANGFGLIPDTDYFGWMGVDLFFALSGFLIGGQLFKPVAQGQAPSYGEFFARRLLRTLPAYFAVLLLYALFPVLWDRHELQPMWQFLTFTQNIFIDPARSNSLSQAWSLCVEEQFYFVLPAAMVLLGRGVRARSVIAVLAAVLAFGMAVRGYQWLAHVARTPFEPASGPSPGGFMRYIYYPTWTRLDGLLAGVALALAKTFRPRVWAKVMARPNLMLLAGMVGVAMSMLVFGEQVTGLWQTVVGFPLLSLGMAALVAAGSEERSWIGRRSVPGAGALAAASYSIYLSHKMAYRLVINLLRGTAFTQAEKLVAAVVVALLVGVILYAAVERPCLKLRGRLRFGRSPALQPAE